MAPAVPRQRRGALLLALLVAGSIAPTASEEEDSDDDEEDDDVYTDGIGPASRPMGSAAWAVAPSIMCMYV